MIVVVLSVLQVIVVAIVLSVPQVIVVALFVLQVSDGAEVIAINKRFLVRHANSTVQQTLHLEAGDGYPSPKEVRHSCHTMLAWDLFKQRLNSDLDVRLDKMQFNHGLYFQPGPLVNPLASVGIISDVR